MTQAPASPRPGGAAPGGTTSARDRPESGAVHAQPGYPSEVRWQAGEGRQPYANRGETEAAEPNSGDVFEAGDRGSHSGTNQEQMRQVRQKP
jgi:hypothetical protein